MEMHSCESDGFEAVGKLYDGSVAKVVYDLARGWCLEVGSPGGGKHILFEIKSEYCPFCPKRLPK